MYKIAVVEDNKNFSETLCKYLKDFSKETGEVFDVQVFSDGIHIAENYSAGFDIVLLDIEMPIMSGLETAKHIRKLDENVVILFVTYMAQYAIKGYEVNAVDFLIKPIEYYNFCDKIKKALRYAKSNQEKDITLHIEDGFLRIQNSKIMFIEKDKNYVVYHTETGIYRERGTLSEVQEKIDRNSFGMCINGCLVNFRHIKQTLPTSVIVGDTELGLSRHRRKEFISEYMDYLRGGK